MHDVRCRGARMSTAGYLAVFCITACALYPRAAAAQGNGHGNGHAYGHYKNQLTASGPSAAGSPELQISGTGIRTFGSWLDDATVMPEGAGSVTLAFSYWRTPAYRELDAPVIDGSIALTRRIQVGLSAPYYHAGVPGGPIARGLGDLYLSTKIQLRDPSMPGRRVGFSATPLVEILSYAPPDASRFSWALPGSIEIRQGPVRAFGSAGYFSRGALFASGAMELALSERVWITGSISRSHSVRKDDLSVALGLTQSRTDLSGSAAVAVLPGMSVFGAVGRTISRHDANSATVSISSGVAFAFNVRD
ncbi:MAG TPA: hypothetical protein VFO14_18075 [Vicinamibacterales bacterium]|nr:hypothetical protein [Vicinamibacterales bacterium]